MTFKKRQLVVLTMLTCGVCVFGNASSCEMPIGGDEYDSQIRLSVTEQSTRTHGIEIPIQMNDTPLYKAVVTYWPKDKESRKEQLFLEIELVKGETTYKGEFISPDQELYSEVELVVVYDSLMGGCGTYAYRKIE